ncbi:MAG: hypothetical protein IJB79_08835 [Candidatus Gastranaerophilales bacterium]|nr:hypothetical protein [Candidatus Gastranaerophilales bacterium]
MPNDYLNPFGASNISNTSSTTTVGSVSVADNSNASIMANNSNSTMNYILSPSDLKEDDIELIKKELARKIQEQKEDLENAKSTRGWVTSAWNGVCGWFDGGDKKAQNNISNYETLLTGLDSDISNIDEVYKTIMGSDLDLASLQSLKSGEALASSIDSQTQEAIVAELENQVALLESNFETAQNSNGWISSTWNAFKNWTGIGASSNKTSAEINDLKEQIAKLKNGEADLATTFKNITGAELNAENLTSLLSGEVGTGLDSISNAGQKVNAYSEGQKMCTDVVGDMVSGIAAVGVVAFGTAIGICAAPFTAGASLGMVAASLGLAAGTGALVKTAIKASDCIGNEKKYGWKDLGYDLATGSINGAAAPLTNALGGAAGTTVMKLFGQEALETTVKSGALLAAKEVAEEVFEEGVEQAGKKLVSTGLTKALSFTADSMVDGGLSGLIDGSSRAMAEGRYEDILSDGWEGFKGGLIASPIMGTGFNIAGKAGSKLGQTALGQVAGKATKEGIQVLGGVLDNLLPQGIKRIIQESSEKLNDRFIQTSLKNCLTISDDGIYSVKTNGYSVQLIESELSEEILEAITRGDNTLVFNYANEILAQKLSKNAADVVANKIIDAEKIAPSTEEQIQERINKLDYANEFDADDISDLVKGIECTKKRLQDNNIEFSEEDILDIMEAGEYFDPSQIITTLTSMSNVKDVGKAYMLSQLIKQGVLSKESLMEITDGWNVSNSFGKAFCDNYRLSSEPDYFSALLRTCNFDDEKIAELINISKMIADGDIATSDLKKIMPNIATMTPEELRNFTSPDKGLNKDIGNLADGKPISNLSDDIVQKLHTFNCNEEQLAKIKGFEKKQLKVFETCLKDSNVEVLLRDGVLKIDDIIDLNYYMNVPGFGEIPIPAGKKQAKQFIKALKDENVVTLLKNGSINIEDVMKIVDYTGSSSLRGYSFNEALKALQDDKVIKLFSSGLDINSAVHATNLTDVQIESFYSVIENSNLDFDVHIVKLQNNAGYEIKAKTKNYIDDEFQTKIQFEYSIGANGEQRCARIEDYGIADGVMTRYKNSDNSILLREYDKKGKLDESIELILNNDGEPIAIVHTKIDTENLQGVYKTVKYNLSDYPEDIDIIEAIKSGKISGGEILTETIKNNDGSVTYKERYNVDNIETSRAYTQKLNENGEMLSSQYQYQIIDKNGGSLMQIERSWIKNSDGSTTTTINGKKYIANFDNASKTISITHENGQTTTIDLSKKQVGETLSKILALIARKPDISTTGQEELWEFYKTLPADSLINLDKYIKKIGKVDNLESAYINIAHILMTGTETSILNHELGHSIDFSNKKQFSKNQKLIDLYNEEMTSFKNNAPPEMQSIISYFSQNGGSQGALNIQRGDTGLNEFIAEVNSLLTTYGHKTDLISARAMYLTRYFPKTIAKIAELLGYSN